MSTTLELAGVSKLHPGAPPVVALDRVDLTVDAGELVAVVGPSGSGKSTLLAVAGTLERPSAGHVRITGVDVGAMGDDELSAVRGRSIGFVFQQFFLIPTLSVLDNVATGLLYRGVAPAERRAAAARALEAVGMAHRAAHRPTALSGGECQRAAIARAVVGDPSIVLADEPTGNVDSRQGGEILELLRVLNGRGATVVVVTHNPEIAAALPRIVELRDGAVARDERRPA